MKYILAHRGICFNYKENTLNSMLEIKKYTNTDIITFGVEFDINLTKDNQLILYHDECIKGYRKKITDMNFDEIKVIDKDITLLKDVLENFVDTNYLLDIELKEYTFNKKLFCDLFLGLMNLYKNRICWITSSFDTTIVNHLYSKNIFRDKIYLLVEKDKLDNDILSDVNKHKYIIHYSNINNEICNKNICGVYTLYESNFDLKYLNNLNNINIFISDDIDKLI